MPRGQFVKMILDLGLLILSLSQWEYWAIICQVLCSLSHDDAGWLAHVHIHSFIYRYIIVFLKGDNRALDERNYRILGRPTDFEIGIDTCALMSLWEPRMNERLSLSSMAGPVMMVMPISLVTSPMRRDKDPEVWRRILSLMMMMMNEWLGMPVNWPAKCKYQRVHTQRALLGFGEKILPARETPHRKDSHSKITFTDLSNQIMVSIHSFSIDFCR